MLIVALARFWPGWRHAILPAIYLLLLVPGAVVAIDHFGLSSARVPISFNLSGPFAIAMSLLFFAQVRTSLERFRLLVWPAVFPILAMATAVLIGTIEAGSIRFTGESNFATSGGFAPNQVSAVLGFGALVCLVLAATERGRGLRLVEIALATCLLAQALLTLARGGVVNVLVAAFLAALTMIRRPRSARRVVLVGVTFAAVARR